MVTSANVSMDDGLDPRVVRSRTRIIAAATELLVEAGPQAVTVDAVAERSGVAKSTMYRHWNSRAEMLVDVIRANMPAFSPPDLDSGFEAALRTWINEIAGTLATPDWARIVPALMALQQHMPELADMVAEDRAAATAQLDDILGLGATEGLLPPGVDPYRASMVLIGPLMFATICGEGDQIAALAEHVLDRFIASYRHDGAPSPGASHEASKST